MKVSEKVKIARKKKGLTQKELAEIVGAATATINKIEADDAKETSIKNTSFRLAVKIASALDVDVFELFGDESLNYQYSKSSEKDVDGLKILVFHSLDKTESDLIFLKQFDHNQEDAADWEKFKEYERNLSEFKKSFLGKLMEVNFCSYDDIRDYQAYVLKQAKERMSRGNRLITSIDSDILEPVDEITQQLEKQEIEQEKIKLQNDPNYIPEKFKTADGRPFIRKDFVTEDGKTVSTFRNPDLPLTPDQG